MSYQKALPLYDRRSSITDSGTLPEQCSVSTPRCWSATRTRYELDKSSLDSLLDNIKLIFYLVVCLVLCVIYCLYFIGIWCVTEKWQSTKTLSLLSVWQYQWVVSTESSLKMLQQEEARRVKNISWSLVTSLVLTTRTTMPQRRISSNQKQKS